ncbi:unnamed protein product [Cercopithifilaria johnstoni]|uniref:Uncharacterized protein n=1 Tax=Cercopithifilaria johnstoni TaxID=2874296 RepID=A0A8J2QAC9_9BILA|nr:unnamed protein product [Cercopithifilaria johnstoni]
MIITNQVRPVLHIYSYSNCSCTATDTTTDTATIAAAVASTGSNNGVAHDCRYGSALYHKAMKYGMPTVSRDRSG